MKNGQSWQAEQELFLPARKVRQKITPEYIAMDGLKFRSAEPHGKLNYAPEEMRGRHLSGQTATFFRRFEICAGHAPVSDKYT